MLWKKQLTACHCPVCDEYAITMEEKHYDKSDGQLKHLCLSCNTIFTPVQLDKELKQPVKGSNLTKFMKRKERTVETYRGGGNGR